jgi:hypothetical protein
MRTIYYLCVFLVILLQQLTTELSSSEYWTLRPYSTELIGNEKHQVYHAIFLSAQSLQAQLSLKGADPERIIAWISLEESLQFSFGQQLTLHINQLNPRDGYVDFNGKRVVCHMAWDAPEAEERSILIPEAPELSDPLTISKQSYKVYKGKIARNEYLYGEEYWHDIGWEMKVVGHQKQSVELEILFENSVIPIPPLNYRWSTDVCIYSERHDPLNIVNNEFMNMCKQWKATDEIIILIHQNYPGYRWIVNATRGGEAFFCKGLQTVSLSPNVWEKMSH